MRLTCAIIDDEPLAVNLLKGYVENTSFLKLAGAFNNVVSAMGTIHSAEVQLLFLDINMPQLSDLEFSKTLPPTVKVVFTTTYDQYAVESFRLNALDYLLKPISYAEFLRAGTKALEWFKLADADQSSSIFVKSGYRIEKIDFDDILYIENQKDYVKLHLEGVIEPVNSLMSMQLLEERLPSSRFMRVHRSSIVNLSKIKAIERNRILFGKEYIPVSDSYKAKFVAFLNKHFFE